jgi:hypothetical protein
MISAPYWQPKNRSIFTAILPPVIWLAPLSKAISGRHPTSIHHQNQFLISFRSNLFHIL